MQLFVTFMKQLLYVGLFCYSERIQIVHTRKQGQESLSQVGSCSVAELGLFTNTWSEHEL
jgi:hypothetical protein